MNVEEQLRRTLNDPRHTVTGWADPVDRVAHGIARRRRRRTMVAGAAVLVAVAAAGVPTMWGATTYTPPVANAAPGPVPWLDQPAPRPTDLARREPLPMADDCRTSSLGRLAWTETGTADNGDPVYTILLGNTGETRCTLHGSVGLRATDAATGQRTDLAVAHVATFADPNGGPATMEPGEPARVDLRAPLTCDGARQPVRYRDVRLVLADGTEKPVSELELRTGCQLTVGDWYALQPLLYADRQVTLIYAPSQVRRGSTVDYVVRILNPSDGLLRLQPCPVYTQRFAGQTQSYRLNCAVDTIEPHRTVEFQMRLRVPADAPLGETRLTWTAVLAGGKVAIANLGAGGVPLTVTP